MRTNRRSNALLVELLIVVMFFMLAFSVLLQVFAAARGQSERAGQITRALAGAQNVADRLYAAEDAEEELAAMGFAGQDGLWAREEDGLETLVSSAIEESGAGALLRAEVRVLAGGDELVSLPLARYAEVTK